MPVDQEIRVLRGKINQSLLVPVEALFGFNEMSISLLALQIAGEESLDKEANDEIVSPQD